MFALTDRDGASERSETEHA